MTFVFFVLITGLLVVEGAALSALIFGSRERTRDILLGLPLASFVNVLIVFLFTVTGIQLIPVTILGAHVLITLAMTYYAWKLPKTPQTTLAPEQKTRLTKAAVIASLIILGANLVYSFSHAVMLPSFQYDSATNWTIRSKISFEDRAMAFDELETRGMAKPQYPFLFHALQITVNQGSTEWGDTAANTILFLLSLSFFGALWYFLRQLRGSNHATLTLGLIIGIPLLGLHLAQGYGDINLAQELLLSLLFFGLWLEESNLRKARAFLFLSSIFVASAVWTKSEGTFIGIIPWIILAEMSMRLLKKSEKKMVLKAILLSIILALPWHIFAQMKGLSLTPHGSDTRIALHPEAIPEALLGLFSRGSFGIVWYVLLLAVPVLGYLAYKKDPTVSRVQTVLLLWGIGIFVAFLFIYLATPNVVYLLKAESYYRQMMIPAAMLVLACSLCVKMKPR